MSWAVRRQSFSSLRCRPRSCERKSKIKLAHVVLKVIYFDRRDVIDSGGGAGYVDVHQILFFFLANLACISNGVTISILLSTFGGPIEYSMLKYCASGGTANNNCILPCKLGRPI